MAVGWLQVQRSELSLMLRTSWTARSWARSPVIPRPMIIQLQGHQWNVATHSERISFLRRDPQWQAERRENRGIPRGRRRRRHAGRHHRPRHLAAVTNHRR